MPQTSKRPPMWRVPHPEQASAWARRGVVAHALAGRLRSFHRDRWSSFLAGLIRASNAMVAAHVAGLDCDVLTFSG